ncbi:hypothetical protein UlMin_008575 [Ulmus minor]
MAEFSADLQSFKPQFPFLDIDPNMEEMTQFSGISPNTVLDNSNLMNFQSFLPFSSENFFTNQAPDFPGNLAENFPGISPVAPQLSASLAGNGLYESRKRKEMDISESSSGITSPQVSETGMRKKNGLGRGKRVKSNGKEEEKPKDVVHVRARRGQATDSHSLAERVRRGKINERLKCLQDIVPGCYKTMGMAVMLDEIINYVQSLQNQVEFLSMKLTAASNFYDFNSETDAMVTLQQRAKANEAKEMERLIREGYGGLACFHSTWPL